MKLKKIINAYMSWEEKEQIEREREKIRGQQKRLDNFEGGK